MKFNLKWVKLGTIFKWAIRPAVWSYDKVWGSDLMDCQVCRAREAEINDWVDNALNWVRKRLTRK